MLGSHHFTTYIIYRFFHSFLLYFDCRKYRQFGGENMQNLCNKEIRQQLGQRITSIRKAHGLTQQELSKKANISRSYLGDVEKDRYSPSVDTLFALANAMDICIVEFFTIPDIKLTDNGLIPDARSVLTDFKRLPPDKQQEFLELSRHVVAVQGKTQKHRVIVLLHLRHVHNFLQKKCLIFF